MKRNFDELMATMKKTIADYSFFVDFDTVFKRVEKVKSGLKKLDTLIGSGNSFDTQFSALLNKDPEILKTIPVMLGERVEKLFVLDNGKEVTYNFEKRINSDAEYLKFLERSGLKDLLANRRIRSSMDYIIGVEAGLNSNARKNRTGTTMENAVYKYLLDLVPGKDVLRQVTKEQVGDHFHNEEVKTINVTAKGDTADKIFDFAFQYDQMIYLVETNFYTGGGSKLNEVARSYEELARKINSKPHVRFIWITDGIGWKSARNNLRESYGVQKFIYNISDLDTLKIDQLINEYTNN